MATNISSAPAVPGARLKTAWPVLLALVCIVALRLVSAYYVSDLWCDEAEVHAHIESMIAAGQDSHGNPHPLYAQEGKGLVTFTYLYPMQFLCRMFGKSVGSTRLIQQLLYILSSFLLAFSVKEWGGGARRFWCVLIVALTLPWGFVQVNRIWDPAIVPVYFGIAFWFVTKVLRAGPEGAKTRHVAGAAVSLVLLAILYPPNRIPAVWLWLCLFVSAWREGRVTPRQLVLAVVFSVLAALPLVYAFFFYPGFNSRPLDLFVFHGRPFGAALLQMAQSFASLFNADFLFATGDRIYRHSLPVFGMLGPLSIVPVWTFLRRGRFERPFSLMAGVIAMTYLSVSFTFDYTPHSLRSCLAWMPWAVLLGWGWDLFLESKGRAGRIAWYVAYAVWFAVYFGFYIHYNV